jgi:hypothetical protein
VTYPVLDEQALRPLGRRRAFRPVWRNPADLPPLRNGAVYVFEYDGRYRDPYARRVNGSELHVIDATAVALIEIRDRLITVHRALSSARPGADLLLTVTFRCSVTNPAAVAQAGLTDLETMLAAHVAADRELATLGRFVWPERASEARLRVEAQLRAHCTVNPPDVVGVECTVAAVSIHADAQATVPIAVPAAAGWPHPSGNANV